MTGPPFSERPGHGADAELATRRAMLAKAVSDGTWRTASPAEQRLVSGVKVLAFAPPGAIQGTILHFHGGGYRQGCPEMLAPFATALAAETGFEVLCPAYRLAPEHPFPAAVNDGWQVWTALREHDHPLILSGDSAGGGLAGAIAALAGRNDRRPDGLMLISSWLDLTVTSRCYEDNAVSDRLFSRAAATQAARQYLQGHPADDPLASPLFAPLLGFPQCLLVVGSGEVLADDCRRFAGRLEQSGVPTSLREIAGMEHVAVTRGFQHHGSQAAFDLLVAFLKRWRRDPAVGDLRPATAAH